MTAEMKPMRDAFIDTVFEAACSNRDIYFLSADLGAASLDRFRSCLPGQFIHMGICEQNMIDFAAGLGLCGKIVYIYAMAPFVTFRCFEQIKISLATMNVPATIVSVGVGYGYDDAGPTHYATEDISCMRSLANCQILSPADTASTIHAAELAWKKPAVRYVRLDRKHLPNLYRGDDRPFAEQGFGHLKVGRDVCLMSTGYMTHRALAVAEALGTRGLDAGVIDIYSLKPLNAQGILAALRDYRYAVSLEEHFLSGGLGGILAEMFVDHRVTVPLKRIGVDDHYFYENGGREYVLKLAGLDAETLEDRISGFVRSSAHRQEHAYGQSEN